MLSRIVATSLRRDDPADLLFHEIADPRHLLDARAGLRTHVQLELARIDGGEEVAAHPRQQRDRHGTARDERHDEESAMAQAALERLAVALPHAGEAALERPVEADERIAARTWMAVVEDAGAQQVLRERRHQRPREEVRGQHREHHRFGERHEQVPRDTRQHEHRHEHDADGECRDQRRDGDLPRAFQDRLVERLAGFEVLADVLDGDRGVVHQDAHRERKAAQGHDVDRLAQRRQCDEGGQDRQRDRHGDDERSAPAAEEEQDHQGREAAREDRFVHDPVHRCTHEHRLVHRRADLEIGRQAVLHPRQFLFHALHDVERRGRAVLQDVHQHRALTVVAHDVRLRLEAVVHLRDIAHVDGPGARRADREVVQLGDGLRTAVQSDVVFELTDLRGTRGQDEVLRIDGVDHIERCQALRLQRPRIDVDHHRPELAAVGVGHHRALHRRELRAHEAVREVEDLVLAERLARQGELEDRDGRGAVREDQRRRRPLRIAAHHRLRDGGDLRQRCGDVRAAVEEHLHHGHAVVRLRLDAFDVVDRRRHRPLEVRDDPAFHLLRGKTVVAPDDADDRDVDVREDVGRHPQDAERADDEHEQREHDERVRAAQGELDNPHGAWREAMSRHAASAPVMPARRASDLR